MTLREAANEILTAAIHAALPDEAVRRALEGHDFGHGRVRLVAIGKAAWQMARAAADCLGDRIETGTVITKYAHAGGPIRNFAIFEAGHPVPDENSFRATQAAVDSVRDLTAEDTVLFLISGGGSALFELPLVPEEELRAVTQQLLACGADITEMNTVRKRISAVKGGKFAALCAPAHVFSVILSDVLGDRLDMIASGPAAQDCSSAEDARRIAEKYALQLSAQMQALLTAPPAPFSNNVETRVTGSVRQLCLAAAERCRALGFTPYILTDCLSCTARDAGAFFASIARTNCRDGRKIAYLAGGETVVRLTGTGRGGRNQELALAAAEGIAGLPNTAVFSVGSDGTDGPTDAAGGYVDGATRDALLEKGFKITDVLQNNDAYHALAQVGGLIVTGPTGTNVNDLSVVLIDP